MGGKPAKSRRTGKVNEEPQEICKSCQFSSGFGKLPHKSVENIPKTWKIKEKLQNPPKSQIHRFSQETDVPATFQRRSSDVPATFQRRFSDVSATFQRRFWRVFLTFGLFGESSPLCGGNGPFRVILCRFCVNLAILGVLGGFWPFSQENSRDSIEIRCFRGVSVFFFSEIAVFWIFCGF